jgi:glycosyltransferase involved in cell wall biosynthesis
MSKLSVIVCTYNPAIEMFVQCLHGIRKAMGGVNVEEVIIVDNNSNPALADRPELRQFNEGPFRILRETVQGLTPARLRGIREAKGELLVFVDDDNLIPEDFFLKGAEIARQNPLMGAFSGQVILEFEEKPEDWTKKYWGLLVYREFDRDVWSNLPHLTITMPCGAGMYVRKEVADYYLELNDSGKRKVQMDRTGKSLFSGGDNDLAACACDIGLGVGLFHKLVLKHYIPKERMRLDYLLKLTRGIYASAVVFKTYRNEFPAPVSARNKLANIFRKVFMNEIDRKFFTATLDGEEEGKRMLYNNLKS